MSSATGPNKPQPPLPETGAVLHQRRGMPFCPIKMGAAGFLIVATIGYFTLGVKAKPGTGPAEVVKVIGGGSPGQSK